MSLSEAEILSNIIRQRKTEKVLCEASSIQEIPSDLQQKNQQIILDAIETAGWAPFHYPRQIDEIAEPWRAHLIWSDNCPKIAQYLTSEIGCTTKEPNLTAGCSALALITWLPEVQRDDLGNLPRATLSAKLARDEEHLAAASAMVQNFLLILTAHGMGTYWSSGGKLGKDDMFQYLNIPRHERLLAAVFIEYPEMMTDGKDRKPGKHRDKRSNRWIREVNL
ncbi:MAG: nitroreductase family protein [Lentisphaeria bacterium]|nr:nitroreductase family protein [Lentisphaeria bacterium]